MWLRMSAPGVAGLVLAAGRAAADCDYDGPYKVTVCELRAAKGEDRDMRPDAFFFEPSKILLLPHVLEGKEESPTGAQDRLAIEVEFNEPIFPYQNRMSAPDRHFGGVTWAVAFTPMYRVRIWKEDSSPVRVPSFMPKATVQANRLGPRRPGRQWGERDDGRRGYARLTSAMLTFGHHSNGQDRCIFVGDDGGTTRPCADRPANIRINRLNGSFSTNYVQASVFRSWLRLPETPSEEALAMRRPGLWKDERLALHAWTLGGTFEHNISADSIFGGSIAPPAHAIYGMNRFRFMGSYERYARSAVKRGFPRVKATAWLQVSTKSEDSDDCGSGAVTDGRPCAPQWGMGGDLNVGLGSKIDFLGAYLRYYHGQDYYNLSFTHRKDDRLQLGLSFTPGRSRAPAFPSLEERVIEEEKRAVDLGVWPCYRKHVEKAAGGGTHEPCEVAR